MVQRLKETVRVRIAAAASALFAEVGFPDATLAAVAERAEVSTGNVYRYFENKDALFEAAVPAAFVAELERRTEARIRALDRVRDVDTLTEGHRYHVLSGELLDHCIAHRERVVILLVRPEGTPFASFPDRFRKKLVAWALAYVAAAYPKLVVTREIRFALDRIYAGFLASIGHALVTFRSPDSTRAAVLHLTAHHLGGLARLFETVGASPHTTNA